MELAALEERTSALTAGPAPDLVPRILRSLPMPRRRQVWLAPAAGLLAGLLIGVVLAGGVSGPEVSEALVDQVVSTQASVDYLSGSFIVEELVRPGTSRSYEGEIFYQSPEYLTLVIAQTGAPSGWAENSVTRVVEPSMSFTLEPFPCPELGGCRDAPSQARSLTGRDPFSRVSPAPLDAVVPVGVLKGALEPIRLPTRVVAGLATVGFEVAAAQARPLLDAYFSAGNFREIHDTDLVSVWLEAERYAPLLLTVTASSSADRTTWAAVRGYEDGTSPYLTLEYETVSFTSSGPLGLAVPDTAVTRNAGFTAGTTEPPIELGMSLVASGETAGLLQSRVWAWSDGRSWLRLDVTEEWEGPGLFGNPGLGVEELPSVNGAIYRAGNDSAVFVHSGEFDAVITGSVAVEDLVAAAAMLPGTYRTVPPDWPEAPVTEAEGAYLPSDLRGFSDPMISSFEGVLVIDLFGGGERSARVTQRPGDRISPPFDPDARAVSLRDSIVRYSPLFGVLEWVEDGIVFTVEGRSLGLAELVTIAESLKPT